MAAPRWLAGLWLVAVARCSDEDRGGRRRPVVLVVADDFRPQVGAFGFDDVETPHLDRLVAGGVSFTRAYAQAPSCNPSRTSFLTGLYPDVTKVFYFEGVAHLTMGARGELDVFTHLRSHGFLTFGVGKLWHWEPVGHPFSKVGGPYFPEPGTYDQEWGCADGEKDGGRCAPTSGQPFLMGKVFPTDDPAPSLFDYRVASNAVAKLRVGADAYARQRRPFLLGCGFHHPHTKWRVPRPLYEKLKKRRRVAAPDAARRTVGAPVHAFGDVNLGPEGQFVDGQRFAVPQRPWRPGSDAMRPDAAVELRRGYLSAVTFMDSQLGRVLDALDDLKLANDTVVIFTSDHGYGLGERGHWGKGSLYEIDARVPLIVRDPHQPAGRGESCAHLVELVDLYKSVVDLANLPFSRTLYTWLEGHSLRPSLARPRGHLRRRDVAITMMPKCLGKATEADNTPFSCNDKSFTWGRIMRAGAAPLVGFAARSEQYRYVAWMRLNATIDAVDWSAAPAFEELYDNAKQRDDDFDSADTVNLVAAADAAAFDDVRRTADRHLGWLRTAARDRFFRAFGQYAHRIHNEHPLIPDGATLDPWKRDRSADRMPKRDAPQKRGGGGVFGFGRRAGREM